MHTQHAASMPDPFLPRLCHIRFCLIYKARIPRSSSRGQHAKTARGTWTASQRSSQPAADHQPSTWSRKFELLRLFTLEPYSQKRLVSFRSIPKEALAKHAAQVHAYAIDATTAMRNLLSWQQNVINLAPCQCATEPISLPIAARNTMKASDQQPIPEATTNPL